MKKGLFRFGVAVLIVLASVAVVDVAVGKVMDWMLSQISNQGDTGKTYYSLYEVNTPIVIVGSSRAAHHYVTQMIEDSLGASTYNVARAGCFFSYNCCVINTILDRCIPKLIIWENGTEYLYEDISDRMESLYPYYNSNRWVANAIREELPWTEYMRLNSRIYQYNSTIHRILLRYRGRHSFMDGTIKGYLPLAPKKLRKQLELELEELSASSLSPSKIERFRSILKRAQDMGVKMVIVDSPKYISRNHKNMSALKMKEICIQYGATYIDNSQIPYFLHHPELFNDAIHMNDNGAKIYTSFFSSQIKTIYTP